MIIETPSVPVMPEPARDGDGTRAGGLFLKPAAFLSRLSSIAQRKPAAIACLRILLAKPERPLFARDV
jgi:hypothetical protein